MNPETYPERRKSTREIDSLFIVRCGEVVFVTPIFWQISWET